MPEGKEEAWQSISEVSGVQDKDYEHLEVLLGVLFNSDT